MKDATIKLVTLIILIALSGCSNYNILQSTSTASKTEKIPSSPQSEYSSTNQITTIDYDTGKLTLFGSTPVKIKKIGVLLPLDESFKDISVAIRDGLISAWYENSVQEYRPQLFFFSTSSPLSNTIERIKREKIDFVIGPLRKMMIPRVENLLPSGVGMLALNTTLPSYVETPGYYQFALAPEDEAIQVAKKARIAGDRMLLIVPKTEWGDRMSQAYKNIWEELNGSIASEISFNPKTSNYSELVKESLNIEGSYSRRRLLKNLIGMKIEFDARRREDIDVILLAANGIQARQILPQLRFHKAENVPIFSSSHVYSDFHSNANNKDLEGLTFGDAPWVTGEENYFLRKTLRDTAHPANDYPRLFAFGRDAYSILPFLKKMEKSPYIRIPGATGNLWLDSDKMIHRELKWFYFRNGRPRWQSNSS